VTFSIEQYSWPAFGGRKPFDNQRATVAFLMKNRRAFVLNDMGTGKTLSAIWGADILMSARRVRRALIVGPKSTLSSVWMRELFMNVPHRSSALAYGPKNKRIDAIKSQAAFVVINHDGIKVVEDELIDEGFDLLIIDELTAFKANSDRTKCMTRIAKAIRGVWGMSGDLTPNSPLEAFYPIRIVNPESKWLPRYYGQFRDACMFQVNEYVWVPKSEAPQVVTMCAQPSIRFTRAQCLDLPETMYHTYDIPLSDDQKKYYDAMAKQAYLETESGDVTAVSAAVKLNKLLQISAGAVKNDAGDVIEIGCRARMDQLLEIFEETPNKKLVVFATYRATIVMLERELGKKGLKCASIYGDVNPKLRASHIERFQTEDLQVLVLQPQSSAHGITLTAAADVVWFSLVPSNELYQQGNARIVRAGQSLTTHIHMFVSTRAESHIAKILEAKGKMSEEILKLFTERML
jgi:SNF2 family DNA or RNA helicase